MVGQPSQWQAFGGASAHGNPRPALPENLPGERCRGRFATASRDAHDGSGTQLEEEACRARDRDAGAARFGDDRDGSWYARADEDFRAIQEVIVLLVTQQKAYGQTLQSRDRGRERFGGSAVAHHHVCPRASKEASKIDSFAAETHNPHPFAQEGLHPSAS